VRLRLFHTGEDNALGEKRAIEAHVPILAGIDVETPSNKNCDLEKSKDEIRHELRLHRSIPEVFRPSEQRARVVEETTNLVGAAIGTELVCLAAPLPASTPSTYDVDATTQGVKSTETLSAAP
ncbi:hypothetical protein HAX54_032037, partial [Datura stramonium]|nr:hypothetical protein [Datura stramonium]